MIVISNTSPISNMLIIGKLNLLHEIVGGLVIPPKVNDEIYRLKDFNINMDDFIKAKWITVIKPTNLALLMELNKLLDPGEADAIALATELNSELIIIDERLGRKVAQQYDIKTIGLLGLLAQAKQKGIVENIKPIINELVEIAGFWISSSLYTDVLKKVNE